MIEVTDLCFSYGARTVVSVPRFQLAPGERVAVMGPSGCGKTTLLHLLAGLLRPHAGVIRIHGQDLARLEGVGLDRFRGRHIGLVFQRFHLLPALTVRENILLAQRLSRAPVRPGHLEALLERLDLAPVAHQRPSMLSVGQAQRVAIARALVHAPMLVMADEPTSALDDLRAAQALDLLKASTEAIGASLLVVTHDRRVDGALDRRFEMAPQP